MKEQQIQLAEKKEGALAAVDKEAEFVELQVEAEVRHATREERDKLV